MALTAKPKKIIDLSKIDDIQNEFFGQDASALEEKQPEPQVDPHKETEKSEILIQATSVLKEPLSTATKGNAAKTKSSEKKSLTAKTLEATEVEPQSRDLKIADLLSASKSTGVRYTTRPYTVPRSLTIDLNRLKSMFRTRELQYTQAELMEKMLKESLDIVTEGNYYDLREKAFPFVKAPDQCSRRSVTLTEDTYFIMSELKANLTQAHARRFSNDELLTMLLAVAFAPLYEQGLL